MEWTEAEVMELVAEMERDLVTEAVAEAEFEAYCLKMDAEVEAANAAMEAWYNSPEALAQAAEERAYYEALEAEARATEAQEPAWL